MNYLILALCGFAAIIAAVFLAYFGIVEVLFACLIAAIGGWMVSKASDWANKKGGGDE